MKTISTKYVEDLSNNPNHSKYDWKFVRPDPDQRSFGEIYKSEIELKIISDLFLPPYSRAVISVLNRNNLPNNIFGYIHQAHSFQEDNINIENFYVEMSAPEIIKITLTNTSNTYNLRLAAGISYGNLVVRRFRKYDDRFIQGIKEKFKTEVLQKGN